MSNRIELYGKSVNKLFDAYFKDELRHGSCRACAVGNILDNNNQWGVLFSTSGMGKQTVAEEDEVIPNIGDLAFLCGLKYGRIRIESLGTPAREEALRIKKEAYELIEKSGYTKEELMKIELGFESANYGESNEDWMFNGLVEVLEILKEIHEISDDGEQVQRFNNEHNRKLELA